MIQIENLEFRYGFAGFRLSIRELAIPPNASVGLLGPSGAGKTTLLLMLAGVKTALGGALRVFDSDLRLMDDRARRQFRVRSIGFVFQDFELLDYLNARENILLPYLIHPRQPLTSEIREQAEALAAEMGLAGKLDRKPGFLSRGEQQRVALCRALLPRPKLILADEPTAGLDPANRDRVMDLLLRHAANTGAILICATHDPALTPRFKRIIDMTSFHNPPRTGEQN